jgi:filamentous hemagglutinin
MADFGDGAGGRRFPLGFRDSSRFRGFARVVRRSLDTAGHHEAEPAMQGSSVTGFRFETTIPFDGGLEPSDHDIVFASSELLARAKAAGVGMRSMGPALRHVRTEPLTLEHNLRQLQILGLDQVAKDASKEAGRDVGFMIYESSELAFARRPTIAIRP